MALNTLVKKPLSYKISITKKYLKVEDEVKKFFSSLSHQQLGSGVKERRIFWKSDLLDGFKLWNPQ